MSDTPEKTDTVVAPAPEAQPEVKPQTETGDKKDARPGPRGRGKPGRGDAPRNPNHRTREEMPSLVKEDRFAPKLRDLDAEIADELEAAMGGLSTQNLMSADSSAKVQNQAQVGEGHNRKQGTVLSVHGQDVFIDVPGGRSQGVIPVEQFPEGPPAPGTQVDVQIEGYDNANGLLILTRKGAAVTVDWSSVAEGMTVEARVVETNKGGLAVEINGIRGFMPISQIDLYRVENAEQFVNQRLLCIVTEVKPDEKNLVVSRRALLEKEREEKREKLWAELAEGQVRDGIVRNVREFGAFIDLGGVDGLLPLGEMSWQRVNDPNKLVSIGQPIKVIVLRLDREAKKVLLGLRQLEKNPWETLDERFPVGSVVKGPVIRTLDFGAIVELEPGIEGMIHISELARQRVWRVADIVKVGQEVEAKILSIDPNQKRIALSLKAMIAPPVEKPKEEEPAEEEVVKPAKPPKPRTTPLKGGTGAGGALFQFEPPTQG